MMSWKTAANRGILGALAIVCTAALMAATPTTASAKNSNNSHPGKVTICHRTSSTSNPYNQQTVNQSSVDGEGGGDHYTNHKGPIWNQTMSNGDNWGDIIPAISGAHSGLNWNSRGKAIWRAGCTAPELPTPPQKPEVPIIVLPPNGGSGSGSGGGAGPIDWNLILGRIEAPGNKLVKVWCTRHGKTISGICRARIKDKELSVRTVCGSGTVVHARIVFSKPGYTDTVWNGTWSVSRYSRSLQPRGDIGC